MASLMLIEGMYKSKNCFHFILLVYNGPRTYLGNVQRICILFQPSMVLIGSGEIWEKLGLPLWPNIFLNNRKTEG